MAKKNQYKSKKIFFLILIVVGLILGVYFFVTYMVTGSSAYGNNCGDHPCKDWNDWVENGTSQGAKDAKEAKKQGKNVEQYQKEKYFGNKKGSIFDLLYKVKNSKKQKTNK